MRKILIVGAGQAGLLLALGLQSQGHDVTVMTNRTADDIRTGRIMSGQCMFATALQVERDLGLNFWEEQTPRLEGVGLSVAAPDGSRPIDWVGRLDSFAQSVDQRVKMAGWLETFAERGGTVVVRAAAVSDLDHSAPAYDLVLVAAGRGEIASMFRRNAAHSRFDTPQRAMSAIYVNGLAPRPEHPEMHAVRANLVPGVGELFIIRGLTTTGPCDILGAEAVPGGPADLFKDVKDPAEHLRLILDLMRRFMPWEYERAAAVEPTDANATLTGTFAPTVREPVAELPSGGLVLGVADVVVTNDPIGAQGSNLAARCAKIYLDAIAAHGDQPFDRRWMQDTFDRFWAVAEPSTKLSNMMLEPPPEHVLDIMGAAGALPAMADRFANGFDDPADFERWFYDPQHAAAYLAELQRA